MESTQDNEQLENSNLFLKILEQGDENEILSFIANSPNLLNEVIPSENRTPFEVLLNHGYENTAKKLIELPDFYLNEAEHNPLRACIKQGFIELAELLLDKNANSNSYLSNAPSILWMALENNLFELADKIIEKGAEINSRDEKGWSSLIRAAYLGRKNIVEYLLNKGANVNICTTDGWNAIVGAYVNNHTDIVSLLEKHNAIFNELYAQAALITSYEKGNKALAKAILDKGISPNFYDNKRAPLVIQAANNEDIDFIEYLISKGVDPNTRNNGAPLLNSLAINGHNSIIQALIDSGADVNLTNSNGDTPLIMACFFKQNKTAEVLLKNKAGINLQNKQGNTALHLAVITENLKLIELLVRNFANTRIRNKDKKTPEDVIIPGGKYGYTTFQQQMINRLHGIFNDD